MYSQIYFSPNSGTLWGSGGLSLGVEGRCRAKFRENVRQLLCAGCGLGEGWCAPVQTKWSLAPLSMEKHNGFATFCFQSSLGPLSPQMPPRCLPDGSQMLPRWLPDASQMPPRWFPDAS